jgi:outer membrane protein TolC
MHTALYASIALLGLVMPRANAQATGVPASGGGGYLGSLANPYRWEALAPVNFSDSGRLDNLLRAGNIYLSLQDAIALALENNLDIAYLRYAPLNAKANLMRARAGGSAGSSLSGIQSGTTEILSQITGLSGGSSGGGSSLSGGSVSTSSGSSGLSLDPSFLVSGQAGHSTSPLVNSFTTGTNTEVYTNRSWQFGIQQAFLTGTNVSLGWTATGITTNASRVDFNPYTTARAELTITQSLLRGFGLAVNNRNIRIAKNSQTIAALQFKQQVSATVSQIISAYWDLVSFYENLAVKRQALELSETLYENTKKEVEVGTAASISIVQAQVEVATRKHDLATAQTSVRQQETALKTVISRTGVANLTIAEAHIIPTDRIRVPEHEQIEPVQDLIARALADRIEMQQGNLSLENSRIALKGTKNALLPSLSIQADLVNNGMAGQSNTGGSTVDPLYLGGFGTTWSQILSRKLPDYAIAFQLSVPLRNRTAKADMIAAQIGLRQQEISQQRLVNSIRAEVRNALIALEEARASYAAAVEAHELAERLLEGERKKYELGTSSLFFVVNYQRDLATAKSAEVQAQSAYAKAKVQLHYLTGHILETNRISIEEAMAGRVARPADALPALAK